MAAAAAAAGAMSARSEQSGTLPNLPIPSIQDSVASFLSSVEPLLSDGEMLKAKEEAAELESRSDLHEALQDLRSECIKQGKSYLEDFWYEGYLKPRGGIAVNVNPFFVLEVSRGACVEIASVCNSQLDGPNLLAGRCDTQQAQSNCTSNFISNLNACFLQNGSPGHAPQ